MAPEPAIILELAPWEYMFLVPGLIVGLQLLFGITSVLVANTVTVRDHSQLGEAKRRC